MGCLVVRIPRGFVGREEEQSWHWLRFFKQPFDVQRGLRVSEGGNSWISFFRHARVWASRRDRQGARDLRTRVRSRVAASGKRNWSRYAPCEKATEINWRARSKTRNRQLDFFLKHETSPLLDWKDGNDLEY